MACRGHSAKTLPETFGSVSRPAWSDIATTVLPSSRQPTAFRPVQLAAYIQTVPAGYGSLQPEAASSGSMNPPRTIQLSSVTQLPRGCQPTAPRYWHLN